MARRTLTGDIEHQRQDITVKQRDRQHRTVQLFGKPPGLSLQLGKDQLAGQAVIKRSDHLLTMALGKAVLTASSEVPII